jgi:hypothetical protein
MEKEYNIRAQSALWMPAKSAFGAAKSKRNEFVGWRADDRCQT